VKVQSLVQGGSVLLLLQRRSKTAHPRRARPKGIRNVDGRGEGRRPERNSKDYEWATQNTIRAHQIWVVFAKMNYFFGDTAAGGKRESKGSHGFDSHSPICTPFLVAYGAGIKLCTNLAKSTTPTSPLPSAKLLGFEIAGAEGKPLLEAMEKLTHAPPSPFFNTHRHGSSYLHIYHVPSERYGRHASPTASTSSFVIFFAAFKSRYIL